MKGDDDYLQDEDMEDEEILEDDPWSPKIVEDKCKNLPTAEDKANCVCNSAEGPDLSKNEIVQRCKKLRFTIFKVKAMPFSCRHAPLVEGCKAFDPWRAKKPVKPVVTPEERQNDADKKVDDNDELDEELEDADEEETVEEQKRVCKDLCKPMAGTCDYFPPLGTEDLKQDKEMASWCAEQCKIQGSDCVGKDAPVVEDRVEDERKKDENEEDPDDFELEEEDLGESDEVKKEKEKEPTLTCASLVKSATPGNLATKAQLQRWCGSQTCGSKLKMRTWAICGLKDGRVSGPGYKGVVGNDGKGPFDCYINCKGEAEKISGLVEDCISEMKNWGPCSRSCGGGTQRKQLVIRKYPSNGGKACPTPPSRRCATHGCPQRDCFPADASVETASGLKLMSDLRVGDKVRSVDGAGRPIYDDIYFFGHADKAQSNTFVSLQLSGSDASLQLSPKHFLPTCPKQGEPCDWSDHIHVYAQEVRSGDYVWIAVDGETTLRPVLSTSFVMKDGLYNPYTLSGKIIVNGVIASAHSDWVLDAWTPAWMSSYLPGIYQVLFLPGRLLYQLAGASAADYLDVNNPQLAGNHGYGPEFLATCLLSGLVVVVTALRGKRLK
jgi:hypothetical protein